MTTPSKPNDVATPLSVVPGVPHWRQTDHDQVDIGQGYDFHDPVSLQIGGESAYKTGTAISMFGKVGFRSDQAVINTDHGRIYELEITRKYGTQGTYDFYIKYDQPASTGFPGDFRTGVEHGFDVCKVDLDLTTLNSQVTAENGAYRIRMETGRSRMILRAIAPYRTKVRTHDPVVLQKPLTYWVREKFNAHVGVDEVALGASYTGGEGCKPSLNNIGLSVAEEGFSKAIDLNGFPTPSVLRNNVTQDNTTYTALTLPVPQSFIEPNVGIPEKEYWRDQFSIYEYENLKYTIGNSFDCHIFSRIYGRHSHYRDTQSPKNTGPAIGNIFNNENQNVVTGLKMYNGFVAPASAGWTDEFIYKVSKPNRYTTSYQSAKRPAFTCTKSDFWSVDYTDYVNEALGELILLENPVEHVGIDSGFNAMWNHHGVDSSTVSDNILTRYVDGTSLPATNKYVSTFYVNKHQTYHKYCGGENYWKWTTQAMKAWADNVVLGDWAVHNPSLINTAGVGEGGTSSVLYDLSSLSHPASSYEKNDTLKGFYKCCTDHTDREVVLTIEKVDLNDPVEMDKTTRSTTYINKSTTYDVSLHALYDNTVEVDHSMPPGAIFIAGQAWDDTPAGDSLTKSLFVPEGADVLSPVQFLSLSAGALAGGSRPRNKLKPPVPKIGPKLQYIPGIDFVDNLGINSTKEYTIQYKNIGEQELTLQFQSTGGGIASITGTAYDSTSTPPSGDKLDDWSWNIQSPYRTDTTNQPNTVALSADEMVYVKYTVNVQTGNPDGYGVMHPYQLNLGPLYGGISDHEVTFNISVF